MTYSNLIMGLSSSHLYDSALKLFRSMLRDGICPNNTITTALLYRIGSSDDPEKDGSLFKELLEYGLKFIANVYMDLLYAYCKHGKFVMAVKVYNDMSHENSWFGARVSRWRYCCGVILLDNPEDDSKLKKEDILTIKSYIRTPLIHETCIQRPGQI
jgi:pentatricopeptide repeat protein